MQHQRWYSLQAAVRGGIPEEKLREALLLYEHRQKRLRQPDEALLECLRDVGTSSSALAKTRFHYLKLRESHSLSGGSSR